MPALAAQVRSLLTRLGRPEVLALGEPTHTEPAFPALRNDVLAVLVEHGFRSVAVQSDRVRGLVVDSHVRGGAGALDDVVADGFGHGPAALAADRALVAWLRSWNAVRPPAQQVAFHGIDAPPAVRTSRLLGVRAALIAENLLAVRAREQHRGPTLVFAHNRHLQRHAATRRPADTDLEWAGAGAIVAAQLGGRYAFVAGSLGASTAVGLPAPATGTFEAALPVVHGELVDPRPVRGAELVVRTDVTPEQGHVPLDAATLADGDALLHVAASPPGPSAEELAQRITALPGVTCLVADEAGGAPEVSWGDRFFHAGDDRRRPFATIVERDVPGFDEASRLDRPGAFRLNVELGRRAFEREFGFPPQDLPDRLAGIDAARLDTVVPHPAYGTYGWASILNPTPGRLPEVDRLLAHALARRRRAV